MLIIWLRATGMMGLDQGMMEQKYKIRGVFMGQVIMCHDHPGYMCHSAGGVGGGCVGGEREGEMDWFVSSNSFQLV